MELRLNEEQVKRIQTALKFAKKAEVKPERIYGYDVLLQYIEDKKSEESA